MCVLFRRVSEPSVVLRSRLCRSHGMSVKKIVSAWFFYLGFSSPLHYVPDGNVHPLPSAVCAFSERISSRLWHAYFFGNYTFRFRVHATRVLFVFFLVISGHACSLVVIAVRSKRTTLVAFSPFFWANLFVNA